MRLSLGLTVGVFDPNLTETVDAESQRNWVVGISDEGPGIPRSERELVIQPFYQCDGSPTRSHGGAGLGMAIASRTASVHGGNLVISDADGGGCLVIFRIPVRPGSELEKPLRGFHGLS